MLDEKGQRAVQRSKLSMQSDTVDAEQAEPPGVDPVLLVDSTGELLQFYQAADLIFVGKSLCEQGGQNPLESAALGKATVVGPHMENFPSVMEILIKDEAVVQVKNRGEWKDQFDALLSDSAARHELGERAANSVAAHRGVLKRTAARVLEERESSCSAS